MTVAVVTPPLRTKTVDRVVRHSPIKVCIADGVARQCAAIPSEERIGKQRTCHAKLEQSGDRLRPSVAISHQTVDIPFSGKVVSVCRRRPRLLNQAKEGGNLVIAQRNRIVSGHDEDTRIVEDLGKRSVFKVRVVERIAILEEVVMHRKLVDPRLYGREGRIELHDIQVVGNGQGMVPLKRVLDVGCFLAQSQPEVFNQRVFLTETADRVEFVSVVLSSLRCVV